MLTRKHGKQKSWLATSLLWLTTLLAIKTINAQTTPVLGLPTSGTTNEIYWNCVTGAGGACGTTLNWIKWSYAFPTRGYHICSVTARTKAGGVFWGMTFTHCLDTNPLTTQTGNPLGLMLQNGGQTDIYALNQGRIRWVWIVKDASYDGG